MAKQVRGRWFNTFILPQHIIESYSVSSPLNKHEVSIVNHQQTLTPLLQVTKSRHRLIWCLPENTVRLINLNQELFNNNLAVKYSDMLVNHIKHSSNNNREEPEYYYMGCVKESKNHSIIDDFLNDNLWVRQLINDALTIVKQSNQISLHGRLTVGSIILNKLDQKLSVLCGRSKFMGPIEYDVAATLQNPLELITFSRLTNKNDTHLVDFFLQVINMINKTYPINKNLLSALLLYFYIGHLNTWQLVQQLYVRQEMDKKQISLSVYSFWKNIKQLLN